LLLLTIKSKREFLVKPRRVAGSKYVSIKRFHRVPYMDYSSSYANYLEKQQIQEVIIKFTSNYESLYTLVTEVYLLCSYAQLR